MDSTKISHDLARIFVPDEHLENFEVTAVKESKGEWLIELTEKQDRTPKELLGKDPVLDGFCNTIDVLTHSVSAKRVFLRFRRRRWKDRGTTIHYENHYNLHIAGAKITPSLGAFLKDAFGY
jgi:hypothetical protein